MKRDEFFELLESWDNIYILIQYLIDYPNVIDEVISIGLSDKGKNNWRAIWIIDKVHEKHPELIKPFIQKLIDALKISTNESKIRHLLKLVSLNPLPKEELSFLLDYSLEKLTKAETAIAIRVHAMQTLYEISELEPDFKSELISIIEHEMDYHSTAGIKSRGKRLLKKLMMQV